MNDRPQKPPYPLRMPDELRKCLEEFATQQGRSLNAEIVARLEATLAHGATLPEMRDRMELMRGLLEVKEEVVSIMKERYELSKLTFALAQVLQEAAQLIYKRESTIETMTVEGSTVQGKAAAVLDKYREFSVPGHKCVFPPDAYEELGLAAKTSNGDSNGKSEDEVPLLKSELVSNKADNRSPSTKRGNRKKANDT